MTGGPKTTPTSTSVAFRKVVLIYRHNVITQYVHPKLTEAYLQLISHYPQTHQKEWTWVHPYMALFIQAGLVALMALIVGGFAGSGGVILAGSFLAYFTMEPQEGSNAFSAYGFPMFWGGCVALAALRRTLTYKDSGSKDYGDYLYRPIKYNPTLHSFDWMMLLSVTVVLSISIGTYILGAEFHNNFLVLQCFVLAAYIINIALKAGGNSTSWMGITIVIMLVALCLPGTIELIAAVTSSLKEGVEWAREARHRPDSWNVASDVSYTYMTLNWVQWPTYAQYEVSYLTYAIGVLYISFMLCDDLMGVGAASKSITELKSRKDNIKGYATGNLKSPFIFMYLTELMFATWSFNITKLMMLICAFLTSMTIWKKYGSQYWKEIGRHLGTLGLKVGPRDYTAPSDPIVLREFATHIAILLCVFASAFTSVTSLTVHILAALVAVKIGSERITLLLLSAMTYHGGLLTVVLFTHNPLSGHIRNQAQRVDQDYAPAAGSGNHSSIEAVNFIRALMHHIISPPKQQVDEAREETTDIACKPRPGRFKTSEVHHGMKIIHLGDLLSTSET